MTTNSDPTQDPIYKHLDKQDNYWQSADRDEGITYQSGWKERWEVERERECDPYGG